MTKPLSQRQIVLAHIEAHPFSTLQEIMEATGMTRTQAKNTVGDLKKLGHVTSSLDDVTGRACYRINSKFAAKKAQPAVAQNTGSHASASIVDGGLRADPSPEGVTIVEQPTPDDVPAAACSDETEQEGALRFCLSMIESSLGILAGEGIVPAIDKLKDRADEAERRFYAEQERAGMATVQRDAWREVAEQYGQETPLDLAGYIGELLNRIATLEANERLPIQFDKPAEMVNHPAHYQGKVECIDAIEAALGPVGFSAFCRGNALKYLFRAGRKGDYNEDIGKANWYMGRAQGAVK